MKIGSVAILVILAAGFYFIEAKFWGVLVMGGSVVVLFFMPWLDCSPVKSIRYRPAFHKTILIVFVVVFLVLGYLGVQPPSPVGEKVSQLGTLLYFAFFLTHAAVEPFRRVQAGAGACHVPSALSAARPPKRTRTQDEKVAFDLRTGRRVLRGHARDGFRGGLPPGAGAARHQRRVVAAARCQAVRQLLPELPWRVDDALQPAQGLGADG